MEFSPEQFYLLRDVAAQIADSRIQFQYSQSALELHFPYHRVEYKPINPVLRWLVTGSAVVISYQLWAQQHTLLKVMAVALLFATIAYLFQGFSLQVEYGGKAVLTFSSARAAFLLASVGTTSDSSEEMLLADIQAIRLTPIQLLADEVEIGQIEVYQAVTNTWHLFAELPLPAARTFASVVQQLTAAPLVNRTAAPAAWPAQVGRRLGQLYHRLSALTYRHS